MIPNRLPRCEVVDAAGRYHALQGCLVDADQPFVQPRESKTFEGCRFSWGKPTIFERRDALDASLTELQKSQIRMGAFAGIVSMPFRMIGHLTESANFIDDSASLQALESHYASMRAKSGGNFLQTFETCISDGYITPFNQASEGFRRRDYFASGFQASSVIFDLSTSVAGGISALNFTYKGTKCLGKNLVRFNRGLMNGAEEFLTTHTFHSPITFQFSAHLNSGFPLDSVRFKKPFAFSSAKQHARNLERVLGATTSGEHVDFVAGSGGVHVYENFARAREAAKLRAGLREDAIPFLQEVGQYRNQVYTGMQSPDGTRGWRLDFDTKNPNKAAHINWWFDPDPLKPKRRYEGMIKIDGVTEGDYLQMLSHFPGFPKPHFDWY